MLLMGALISFNYNILRIAKDTLIVTAEESGAETIPFIKVWVLLPMAILMTYIFTKFSNKFRKDQVFYLMISIFLLFFSVFIFVLYPARDLIQPYNIANHLQLILPKGFKGLIAIFRNWTFTSYYVMAELWGSVILSLLFWGLANEITNLREARRFYGLIGISLNLAGILSGQFSALLSQHSYNPNFFFGHDAWEQSLILLISTVNICSVFIMIIFYRLHKKRSKTPNENIPDSYKQKVKMSMRETFSYLTKSKYLMYIALIVLSYNIVINLVEVLWKGELKQLYPIPNDYNAHMSQVSTAMGIIATFISLSISSQCIRKFGWTFTASITPMILFISSVGFFAFLFVKIYLNELAFIFFGASPLLVVCLFGSLHNAFCRGAKYSVFDTTKEIAFIPLSPECKLKGKAAIDGVCSRLGKSSGSIIHQGLLMTFATLTNSAPYVSIIVLITIIVWLFAVKNLGKEVAPLVKENNVYN